MAAPPTPMGTLSRTPRGVPHRLSDAHVCSHLSPPQAHVHTCSYPHAVPRAPPPPSVSHTAQGGAGGTAHTQDHLAPLPCCPSSSTRDGHAAYSLFPPQVSFVQPHPLLMHTEMSRHAPPLPFLALSPAPRCMQSPGATAGMDVSPGPCMCTHSLFLSRVHTFFFKSSPSFPSPAHPLACSLPCSFTCSQSPKHIYTFKLTLPPPFYV